MNKHTQKTLSGLGFTHADEPVWSNGKNRILVNSFSSLDEARTIALKERVHLGIVSILDKIHSYIITPEGGSLEILHDTDVSGSGGASYGALESFIQKRIMQTHWFQTTLETDIPYSMTEKEKIFLEGFLDFAQKTRLLKDISGNISLRSGPSGIYISPRGFDKSKITVSDFVYSKFADEGKTEIITYGRNKSSIDTGVNLLLYERYPEIIALLHTHTPWVITDKETTFPYPCGSKEEYDEIESSKAFETEKETAFTLVKLRDHGSIVAIRNQEEAMKLKDQWDEVTKDFILHMKEVGKEDYVSEGHIDPIITSLGIIGYVFEGKDGAISPRIHPKYQGFGYGRGLIRLIVKSGKNIKTISACGVEEYYKKNGFEVVSRENGYIMLSYIL